VTILQAYIFFVPVSNHVESNERDSEFLCGSEVTKK